MQHNTVTILMVPLYYVIYFLSFPYDVIFLKQLIHSIVLKNSRASQIMWALYRQRELKS